MDLLARREHSRHELVRKLSRRVDNPVYLEDALNGLVEDNLLSDERFCGAFVRSRQIGGYGPVRVKAELRERGVSDTLISEYLDVNDPCWHQHLLELINKKYGLDPDKSLPARAKQQRFLVQRGYSFEQIKQALVR